MSSISMPLAPLGSKNVARKPMNIGIARMPISGVKAQPAALRPPRTIGDKMPADFPRATIVATPEFLN